MNIALINSPVSVRSPHSRLAPPLGLAYIASVLQANGFSVSAIDFNISGLNLRRVDRLVKIERPAVVGISAHTETYCNALKIAHRLKVNDPRIKVVMGGPHPTLLPRQALTEEAVDFVCIGEGENTMLELCQKIAAGETDFDSIKGLGFKNNGEVVINPRNALMDPDALPYPARDLFPLDFYTDRWNVLTARGGCPFSCPFCSASQIWGGRRMARDPKKIVAEVKMLINRYGADYIFFSDDIFTINKSWVLELLGLLEKELPTPLEWGCSTRVDLVDAELLAAMAKAGCRAIHYGVESGSQKVLDSVKGIKKEEVLTAVATAHQLGIKVASSFMIPFPEDTAETIRETKDFIQQVRNQGSKVLLSFTTPFPGTYFYENSERLGLKILAESWEEYDTKHNILETAHLSKNDVEQLVEEIVNDVGLARVTG
ncbi:MAG: B12-binding domain-containing radical SAM protein [Firmicutes bacterium]|nr:B12-binding domain-containing radical SAM protein [Bacillota bacterium]